MRRLGIYTHECAMCGQSFEGHSLADFCSTKCRQAFNNRRQKRGVELYDLLMLNCFSDSEHRKDRLTASIRERVEAWHTADDGKRSWNEITVPRDQLTQTAQPLWPAARRAQAKSRRAARSHGRPSRRTPLPPRRQAG